jgi:hypothetical protein
MKIEAAAQPRLLPEGRVSLDADYHAGWLPAWKASSGSGIIEVLPYKIERVWAL